MEKKVLIIEDDKDITDLVEIHLSDLGYFLDKAYDDESGLSKALSNDYDLVLLDLMLPKLEGSDFSMIH
jgi:DNA-binding response OmpR family regulator